jgi:hypothetical protein
VGAAGAGAGEGMMYGRGAGASMVSTKQGNTYDDERSAQVSVVSMQQWTTPSSSHRRT